MSSEEHRSRIRSLAEQQIAETPLNIKAMSSEEVQALVHELQVHQIELELQNEELRVTQTELDTSRRKYLDLYEFSPVGLLTLDQEERILEANLTLARMLDLDRSRLINHHLSDFIDSSTQDGYHFFFPESAPDTAARSDRNHVTGRR